jgi:hypothetical protein
MFRMETIKALSATLMEVGMYCALFILPLALCVFHSIHSACTAI